MEAALSCGGMQVVCHRGPLGATHLLGRLGQTTCLFLPVHLLEALEFQLKTAGTKGRVHLLRVILPALPKLMLQLQLQLGPLCSEHIQHQVRLLLEIGQLPLTDCKEVSSQEFPKAQMKDGLGGTSKLTRRSMHWGCMSR